MENITIKNKTLLISFALILFLVLGAVSAADTSDVSIKEDSNLDESVQASLSPDKLEISDEDSISKTNMVDSQNDNLSYSDESAVADNSSLENNDENLQASYDDNNMAMDSDSQASDAKVSSSNGESVFASSQNTQNKRNTVIIPDATDTYILPNSKYEFSVTLKTTNNIPISGAKIYFTYNNKKVTSITDKKGKATITIPVLPKGTYTISYTFNGDSRYTKSSESGKLHVQGSTVYLKASNMEMVYKDRSKFKVKVENVTTKRPLAYVKVKFTINGKTYVDYTNSKGNAYLPIDLPPGTYRIKIKYSALGKEDYKLAYKEITVKKQTLHLKAYNLEMKYKKGSFYKVIVKQKGKYMKNVAVKFTVNGKSYIRKTDSKGIAKLRIINLQVGYHPIKSVVHDRYYKSDAKYKKVLVNGYKLIGKSIKAIKGKSVVYSVKAVDGKGNPIKYFKVYFKIHGKTYKAFTNKKGVARVDIGKLKKGTHKIKFRHGYASGKAKIYVKTYSPYLAESDNCQVNNAKIRKLVAELTGGKTTDSEKARAIFNFVRDTISYSFYYDTRYGAVGTLDAETGNCVDHSHLLVAMYRAAGLPARYVHGTCTFSSGNTYGHVWTQVSIGNKWIVSDATSSRNSFGEIVNWNTDSYSLHGYYRSLPF